MTAIHISMSELDTEGTETLLSAHHVGLMALAHRDRVTIVLVNHVYADQSIYGWLEGGPDVPTLHHHQWVAFSVSEIDGIDAARSSAAALRDSSFTNGDVMMSNDAEQRRRDREQTLIADHRRVLAALNAAVANESRATEQQRAGDISAMPTHLADLGTDTMQAEMDAANVTRLTRELADIDAELARLRTGR